MSNSVLALRDDPVIVLGMHHSGTSIFAELLHRHGVYMHPTNKLSKKRYESKFFNQQVNGRVMGGDAEWARSPIMSVDEVMAKTDEVRSVLADKALKKLVRDGYDGESAWGFKDPRTCVTLPLFLQLFPRARLLHIVRDEHDVAESLATKSPIDGRLIEDRAYWRDLRDQYIGRVREYGSGWPDYYEFSYEDFCLQPIETTKPIFERLGLPFTPEAEEFLKTRIYTNRIGKERPSGQG